MATEPVSLVYCASGNRRFAGIAINAGFLYGAQLPHTVYFAPWFADQDWQKPNRERYMAALAEHRPYMASVLDWEREDQLSEVLEWAEDAAQFAETIMLIPKVQGGVERLPRSIGGKPVRLGYSVPTRHGGTELGLWEFCGWPIHLLGGSPQVQMQISHYLDVRSADGNLHQRAAMYCTYWERGRWCKGTGKFGGHDAMYRAFDLSCQNIIASWRKL